jgi:hypothetical protein
MSEGSDPGFEMPAQISTFWRRLDRKGSVSIGEGRLALRKRDGLIIAEAPITEVVASKQKTSAGTAAKLRVNDKTYIVDPLGFEYHPTFELQVAESVRMLANLKRGRALTEQFLTAITDLGGRAGDNSDNGPTNATPR